MALSLSIDGILGASDAFTGDFLSTYFPLLAEMVATPVYLIALLYWGYYVIAGYMGYAVFSPKDILSRFVFTVLLFATLKWDGFGGAIYATFVNLMESTAGTIMGGAHASTMLQGFTNSVSQVASKLMEADFYALAVIAVGLVLFLVNCLLVVVAIACMTISKFGLALTMVLCPLFLGFSIFPATRQWFYNWISQMLFFTFFYILVIVIVKFGFSAFDTIIQSADAANLVAEDFLKLADVAYLIIVEVILIYFMDKAQMWAATLSGGGGSSGGGLSALITSGISYALGKYKGKEKK